jgi:hypothetical protein
MFKVLIPGVIGVVFILLLRMPKQESKNYRINERNESFYIDTNGTNNEYINKQININRYEH